MYVVFDESAESKNIGFLELCLVDFFERDALRTPMAGLFLEATFVTGLLAFEKALLAVIGI